MRNLHNSVETVNAAATAIISAETRVQPSMVQKRRWGNCWSIYWCFGSNKQTKRITHAVLVSEPTPRFVSPIVDNQTYTSTVLLPFIAPPSSPTSFLQSDPSSGSHSPTGLLSLKSLSVRAPSIDGTTIFTVGPYAHETRLVSPPVFSAFTTEPSTASFTPPPEPLQMTSPSSPEVPFAELLSSSLAGNGKSCGGNLKYSLSQYEFKPYRYPGSPGGEIKSPNSGFSNSGTSSPFPDKPPTIVFHIGDPPKVVGYELNCKWSSGKITPDTAISVIDSGTLTPENDEAVVDHRVSFELFGEDIPICIVREAVPSDRYATNKMNNAVMMEADDSHEKHRTISFGSSKDFHFNSSKEEEEAGKSSVECEWWTEDKSGGKQWNFFSMLQQSSSS